MRPTIVALLLMTALQTCAYSDTSFTCPLTGISRLYVRNAASSELTDNGLDMGMLNRTVTTTLRKSGISVIGSSGSMYSVTASCVPITVGTSVAGWAVSVEAKLTEVTKIDRLGPLPVTVTTWEEGGDLITDASHMNSTIDGLAQSLTQDFSHQRKEWSTP